MARILAAVQLDPDRAPEQAAFLAERVTVLRQSGGQLWVEMEDTQVPTLLAEGMDVQPQAGGGVVELPALAFRPATETAEPPPNLTAPEPAGDEEGFWLVHFRSPVDKGWLTEIAALGGTHVQSVPVQAGVFRLTGAQAESVRALAYVDYAGPWHPAYAVSPELAAAEAPFTASSLRNMRVALPATVLAEPAQPDAVVPNGNLLVRTFDGWNPEALRPGLEAAGATVMEPAGQGFLLRVPPARVEAVLRVPGVFAAELPSIGSPDANNSGVIVGTNQVRTVGTVNFLVNLDGTGEVAGMVDTGVDVGSLAGGTPPVTGVFTPFHPDLANRVRIIRNTANPTNAALTAPDNSPHGTHVAGIICGDGTSTLPNAVRGMAPGAALAVFGPINVGNFLPSFEVAADSGARVINNSWGSFPVGGISNNRYTPAVAAVIDQWCFLHPDMLVLFTTGNVEEDVLPAPGGDGRLDARRLRLQCVAKNVLGVGASEGVRNNGGWSDSWRAFTGRYAHAGFAATAGGGPVAFSISDNANDVALISGRGRVQTNTGANTNRVKPDLVAPGTNILSLHSRWVGPNPVLPTIPPPAAAPAQQFFPAGVPQALYELMTGTSMACPMTTGCAVLVRQFYRTRFDQMRRPLLLEGAVLPAAPPLPDFAALPALSPHADGVVFAWVTPDLPANARRIVAMRFSRRLAPVDGAPVPLQAAVGDTAAPKLARRDTQTYLLHRHGGASMRLTCLDRQLAPVAGFGAAGVVTLATAARPDAGVPPDLLVVGDHVACAFPAVGTGYFIQRFRFDTGAPVDGAAINFLTTDHTGPHRVLEWTGARYTVCGVLRPAGRHRLQVRQMNPDGSLAGAGPTTLVDQPQEIRDPCLLWDARAARHLLAWCDARTAPGGEIYALFLDASAAAVGAPFLVMSAPAAARMRRPRVLPHPDQGYVLLWEDDSQNAHFDLYFTFLDITGQVDGRLQPDAGDPLNRRLVRVSDTPLDTDGFAAAVDAEGITLSLQSPDEVNSDRVGVYALNLTKGGAFEAQEDPNTPLLRSGRYVTADLLRHGTTALTALSAVWTGGAYYLLRQAPGLVPGGNQLQWVRLNADGRVDASYAVAGVRSVPLTVMATGCDILWTGNELISAANDALTGITVHRMDGQGAAVPAFGVAGTAALADPAPVTRAVPPQVGLDGARVLVAYGTTQAGALQLRYQRLNAAGVRVGAPVNLAQASGVARQNWWQWVSGASRAIAIYHRVAGPVTRVHCRRFRADGTPDGVERDLSAGAGEGINGVIARRPTFVNSPDREFGAVWQHRAAPANRWEIRFSRLGPDGAPMAALPVPPAPPPPPPIGVGVGFVVTDVPVVNAAQGFPAHLDAVEPQLISTYTHEPWASAPPVPAGTRLPEWSPAYGLAWIGESPADGSRALFFTVLDENGRQLRVPQPPPPPPGPLAPPAPVPFLQLTTAGARVREFKLVWNGRIFLLNWTEEVGTELVHRCAFVNRHAAQRAYDLPSAALLRATLVNGATNITPATLPDVTAGYGWGRVNLRQSLAPAPPVTMYVRDDSAIGPGRTATYRFTLPPGTALLRVTLNWTDPPGPRVVNQLHLTVRAPAVAPNPPAEYRGNLWSAAPNGHLSRPVNPAAAADAHEDVHPFKQVVVRNPPAGVYAVEVSVPLFPADPFNQQNLQPFALVFAGTGPEVAFNLPVAAVAGAGIY